MLLVMTLHSHTHNLTQNLSHRKNIHLISSVIVETLHLFVTKYIANVNLFCVLGLKCSLFLTFFGEEHSSYISLFAEQPEEKRMWCFL